MNKLSPLRGHLLVLEASNVIPAIALYSMAVKHFWSTFINEEGNRLGCRVFDALAMSVNDIDFEHGTVTVLDLRNVSSCRVTIVGQIWVRGIDSVQINCLG